MRRVFFRLAFSLADRIFRPMKNGGNGHDRNGEGRIIKFPSSAERLSGQKQKERSAKERAEAAAKLALRAQRGNASEPFLKLGNIPPFTKFLTASILLVHIALYLFAGEDVRTLIFDRFGFVPGVYTGALEWRWSALISPLSHVFLHGGWMHLAFNLVMTLAFGTFFEKAYGTRKTAIFFTLCCLAGALTTLAFEPFSTAPIIGASGGLSGWFGALLLMIHGQNGSRGSKYGPWPVVVFWGLIMVGPGLLAHSALAWQAHLGGYLAGLILTVLIQKRKIRL